MPRRKGEVQEVFYKKLQRRPGQPMADWVHVFEKAVLDMKAEGLNVELASLGWLFEKGNLTLERQERVLGCAEGECEFAAIRGALIKSAKKNAQFQTESQVMCLTGSQMTDSRTDFRKPRDGKSGRYTAHVTQRKIPIPRKKSRVKKKQT